jgi:4'-phosphopantetheinyl transferase
MNVEVVTAQWSGESEATAARMLSEAERQRASRFAFDRDRHIFVLARARLRELLGVRLGVRPETVDFTFGVYGKPALARPFAESGLRFNLSHRDDVAAYAFSREGEVGIDVEAVRVIDDADGIAASVFSSRELEAYLSLGRPDRPLGFFNCWTRKEAFVKALGGGLSLPLRGFDVSLAPGDPARILRVGETPGDDCGWRMESFSPAPAFVGAVVTEVA